MAATLLGERSAMRLLALALLLTLPAAAAHAEPTMEARSATAACLSAVIDGAPVEDVDGEAVTIRRGKDPVSCTVTVSAGEPVVIHDAVMTSIKKRAELFSAARTSWDKAEFASRETFCNISTVRRALNVFVSTGKPGMQPVAVVTVFEVPKRDARCDRDMGMQTIAAAKAPEPAAEPAKVEAPAKAEDPAKAKSKGWKMPHIPGMPRKKS